MFVAHFIIFITFAKYYIIIHVTVLAADYVSRFCVCVHRLLNE